MRPVRAAALLAVGLLIFGGAVASRAAAETVPPTDIRVNLFGACFANPNVGWVAGDLGRVFRTDDGGKSWTRQEPSGRKPYFSITCVDESHAWVASTQGTIYGTTDGGTTWKEQKTPVDRNFLQVRFANQNRGTAVGDFGQIVHTEDGGATWTQVHLPEDFKLPDSALDMGIAPDDALLYGLNYLDADHAWVCGEFGTILATDDGGKTWRQQQSGVESTLFGISFTTPQHGVAVGIDSTILMTEDGGATWNPVRSPFQELSYYDVGFSDGIGWIVGSRGTLLSSKDGGKTWASFPTPIQFASEWFRGLSLSGTTGYIVGGAGLLYKTEGDQATLLGGPTADKRVVEHGG
jgi:photosystem II stability/assembly factor-like uncharacterized protein